MRHHARQPDAAVMNYLRQPGDGSYKAVGVDVLRIEEGVIAEIVSFDVQHLIDAFGLPSTLQ
jgi:RNA polymerase sigma-70 factor (ECF subfamily)